MWNSRGESAKTAARRTRASSYLPATPAPLSNAKPDNRAAAPEFTRTPKFETQDHGIGTVLAIGRLVVGMSPAQAIVASARSRQFGTLEPGKRADLLILNANLLDDIRQLRGVSTIVRDGEVEAVADPAAR